MGTFETLGMPRKALGCTVQLHSVLRAVCGDGVSGRRQLSCMPVVPIVVPVVVPVVPVAPGSLTVTSLSILVHPL